MKVRLLMAQSPNGYIARLDGAEDWLSSKNWDELLQQVAECDNFIIGRETYEVVQRLYGDYNFDTIKASHKLIVTRNADFQAPAEYTVVHSPEEALTYLESQGKETVLLTGGGELNAAFLKAQLVDEIILIFEPHIIGRGKTVMAPDDYELSLELTDVSRIEDDRVKLQYTVRS